MLLFINIVLSDSQFESISYVRMFGYSLSSCIYSLTFSSLGLPIIRTPFLHVEMTVSLVKSKVLSFRL